MYLHMRLAEEFGRVVIARAGEGAAACMVPGPRGERVEFLENLEGEYYRVNCPYCNDTRQRLWVNHRWGVGFKEYTGHDFGWAVHCYNEDCLSDWQRRKLLKERIYHMHSRYRGQHIQILEGQLEAPITGPVQDPGTLTPVDQLHPGHPAAHYLTTRGFDLQYLAKYYRVSYCSQALPAFKGAEGRIIVPILQDGEQLNWQGRHIPDVDWKKTGIAKYYNCPGVSKRSLVYGLDDAKGMPFAIIVEGVTDVWAIGAGALGILGKTMSPHQLNKILEEDFTTAIVMLDADARDNALDLLARLSQRVRVVDVALPAQTDPAGMIQIDPEGFWDLVYGKAWAQGVDLLRLAPVQ
jgi:hypothetical protein